MNIVLVIATLLGGAAAIGYFVDKFRKRRSASSSTNPNQGDAPRPVRPDQLTEAGGSVFGATHSGRHPFFIDEPLSDLREAKKLAKRSGKPLFLVIFDDKHPSRSKLFYSLGCFLDYFTTKKLVDDHFVAALVAVSNAGARELVPEDDPLENCLWVVLSPDGQVLKREGVYANPDEGLKRVREVVGQAEA